MQMFEIETAPLLLLSKQNLKCSCKTKEVDNQFNQSNQIDNQFNRSNQIDNQFSAQTFQIQVPFFPYASSFLAYWFLSTSYIKIAMLFQERHIVKSVSY